MAWISPTGHNDPSGHWVVEANAYDGNTGTHAISTGTGFLELTISETWCSKVRFYAHSAASERIDLDVYYNGAWHNVYQGVFTYFQWVEKELGGTYAVTKARVSGYYAGALNLNEFEFFETTPPAAPRSRGLIIG